MNKHSNKMKEKLASLIAELAESPELFVKNPGKDFTRNRKLPFETVVQMLISMGGNSIYKELLEAQGYDADTYYNSNPTGSGHNLLHLNAIYDLCSRIYVDALVQPSRQENKPRALVDMIGRSSIKEKVIIIADRAYESYNNFAHIEKKGWNYLIRVKDLNSNGILSGLRLPSDGEFDIDVQRVLTRKQTKEIKAQPDVFRFMPSVVNFDFLPLCSEGSYTKPQ